jgi:hypothetical protein
MACRGVLFAITEREAADLQRRANQGPSLLARLLGRADTADARDSSVLAGIETIEGRWDNDWLCETDKAWDAIHRCFSGGKLSFDFDKPLEGVILGGESLHQGDDYLVSLKTPAQVKEIAAAVAGVSDADLARRYDELSEDDYGCPKSSDDRDYTLGWFSQVRDFYPKAAAADRPVIFTVDQ